MTNPNDPIDAIMSIMEKAFPPQYGEAWNRRQLSDSFLFPTTQYLLIDADGQDPVQYSDAIGFLLSRIAPEEEEILLIAILPEFRGQGLGKALIKRFIYTACENGTKKLFLEMRENNDARKLYESVGFKPVGIRKGYYKAANLERIDAITFAQDI